MKALITGSSKGIGKAICDKLALMGYDLVLNARNQNDLAAQQSKLQSQYPNQQFDCYPADLSVKANVLALGQFICDSKNLDVLINNAGIFIPGAIAEENDGALEQMMQTNLYSAYHLTRKVLSLLKASPKAHIFNMCSVASEMAYPNGGSYSISKFALLGFSKGLREELKPDNIKVTSILPGATWSNSWAGVDLPQERLMEASDVAEIVAAALTLSNSAVLEEVTLRPQLGDL